LHCQLLSLRRPGGSGYGRPDDKMCINYLMLAFHFGPDLVICRLPGEIVDA
jgi:hypothetical protein